MMTAKINFITNNLLVDMTCRETELRDSLQNIGILIVPSMIYLDNRRTLQIQLNANDEVGEIVKTLINTERDTLGTVQRLCRSFYCLNAKHRAELIEMIENGEIIGHISMETCDRLEASKKSLQRIDANIKKKIGYYVSIGKNEMETNKLIADEFMAEFCHEYEKYRNIEAEIRALLNCSDGDVFHINFENGEVIKIRPQIAN